MARNYRNNEEYENDSVFGDDGANTDEYVDFDDEAGGAQLYDDEYEDAEAGEDEYADEDEYEYEDEYEDERDGGYADDEEDEYLRETEAAEDAEEYDDGSNYSVFERLHKQQGASDDGEYADDYDDQPDEGYYEEDGDEANRYDDELDPGAGRAASGKLAAIMDRLSQVTDNDYILWALLILLPPIGLLLMFYGRKWDSRRRSVWLVVASLCLVLWIVLLMPKGASVDITDDNTFNNIGQITDASPAPSNTPVPAITGAEDKPEPSPTLHTSATTADASNTDSTVTYVYANNTSNFYHTLSDCGGMTNASKITLDVALGRNLVPCPICAGGGSGSTDPSNTSTTYYATARGTWYHVDPNCQDMKGATITTISAATLAGKVACPVCIGYYGRPDGTWYHSISNCQSMTNAVVKTKAEWESMGKIPCPICLGGGNAIKGNKVPSETQVFATAGGANFHTQNNCRGMKGASQNGISRAAAMGKTACATCVKPSAIYVFATAGGKYYHTLPTCGGMKNPQYVTAEYAIKYGKTVCPTCAKMLSGVKGFGSSSAADATTSTTTSTYVYATANGTYLHTDSTCAGMVGAKRVTYASAISAGKKICPTCVTPASLTVFCTAGGKYFHTNSTCTGMEGAVSMSASKALRYGKTACPTCAKALKTQSVDAGSYTEENTLLAGMDSAQFAALASGAETPVWTRLSLQTQTDAGARSTVYIPSGAGQDYYHLIAKCAAMDFYNGRAVTLEFALSNGFNCCPACNPPSVIASL